MKYYAKKIAAVMLAICMHAFAHASELSVLSSNASRTAVQVLVPLFEKHSGHSISIRFANNPILKQDVQKGTTFDVLIIEPGMLSELAQERKIEEASQIDLARVGMGLLGHVSAPRLDLSTPEKFKSALLSAESIAYSADGHSGGVFLRTLERLDILDSIKSKLKPISGRPATPLIASGEIQYYAGPISTPAAGTALIGHFPEEVQTYVGVSAGLSANCANLEVATKFMEFLRTSEVMEVFSQMGFQPLQVR